MFINLTPHQVTLVNDQGHVVLVVEPEQTPARCSSTRSVVDNIHGVQINRAVFGETTGLPEYEFGQWLIVSRIVAEANPHRSDLLVPDETVRDDKGQIVGCKSFATCASPEAWSDFKDEKLSYCQPDWWGDCDNPSQG